MPHDPFVVREGSPRDILRLAAKVVSDGLPLAVLDDLAEAGFTSTELGDLVINPRTLRHRRARGEALSLEESERAVRLARLLGAAESLFGDRPAAWHWLRAVNASLEGARPVDLLKTEIGARAVEDTLVRLEHGIFA